MGDVLTLIQLKERVLSHASGQGLDITHSELHRAAKKLLPYHSFGGKWLMHFGRDQDGYAVLTRVKIEFYHIGDRMKTFRANQWMK